jgi:hypothetical protein
MRFVRFMNTPTGRSIRAAAGAAMIVGGIAAGGGAGWAVAAFGLLPLVTGIGDICPISPLMGEPLRGGCAPDGSSCR